VKAATSEVVHLAVAIPHPEPVPSISMTSSKGKRERRGRSHMTLIILNLADRISRTMVDTTTCRHNTLEAGFASLLISTLTM